MDNNFELIIDRTNSDLIPFADSLQKKLNVIADLDTKTNFEQRDCVKSSLLVNDIRDAEMRFKRARAPFLFCVILLSDKNVEQKIIDELFNITTREPATQFYVLYVDLPSDQVQALEAIVGVDTLQVNDENLIDVHRFLKDEYSEGRESPSGLRQKKSRTPVRTTNKINPPSTDTVEERASSIDDQPAAFSRTKKEPAGVNAEKPDLTPISGSDDESDYVSDELTSITRPNKPIQPETTDETRSTLSSSRHEPRDETEQTISRTRSHRSKTHPNRPGAYDSKPTSYPQLAPSRGTTGQPPPSLPSSVNRKSHQPPPISVDSVTFKDVLYRYNPIPSGGKFDDYSENETSAFKGIDLGEGNRWYFAGASRRGLSHWHKGSHRDDAFEATMMLDWHIVALADGAGSAKLSRVTANESCRMAVDIIKGYAHPRPTTLDEARARMETAIQDAVRQIHQWQTQFTHDNGLERRDTYCTLLILIHQPLPDKGCVFATLQVGDGYMLGMSRNNSHRIAQGDHGQDVGTSRFVLSFTADELAARVRSFHSANQVHTFLLASDGIEDDLKPSVSDFNRNITIDTNFAVFTERLLDTYLSWPDPDDWGTLLADAISYDRQGSYDDRTLVILTLAPEDQPYYEDKS